MNRTVLFLMLFAAAGLAFGANPSKKEAPAETPAAVETPAADPAQTALSLINAGNIDGAIEQYPSITNEAARLFVQARIEQSRGAPKKAIQTLSKLIVLYPGNTNWIAQSDLLSAELYIQLGLLDAADVAARQAQTFYEGTAAAEKATALRAQIEKLKEDAK